MSEHRIHFYDAANPHNVPSGVYAAVYVNGYAWPESQIRRMHRVIRISVLREAYWARYARVIDVETGAARPEDVVPFLRHRLEFGHRDGTAYVNRSNHAIVAELVKEAGIPCRFWVATLDGTADIPGAWAVQYSGGERTAYDLSILDGIDDFEPAR